MSPPPRQFRLPDLLSACPLKDETNPYYKEAAAESRAWINSFEIFTDRKRAFFVQGQNELLCSHVYSFAGFEQFRTTCDFVNLLFVLDETSDEQNGSDAQVTGRTFVNAMKDPEWDDGSTIARITKDFRARFMRRAGDNNARRFFDLCETYTQCVGREAELRERDEVLGLEEFVPHRRHNSAVMLCFALVEYILGIDLDDKIYEDPTFMDAYWAACDHICWSNDVYSYDMEQSRGLTGNNIVRVLMEERGYSLQEASDYIGVQCNHFLDTYLKARKQLSQSLGPEATQFIHSIGQWMIGNLVWSFETVRYFGSRHLEVKETGVVTLRPRQPTHDDSCESSDED